MAKRPNYTVLFEGLEAADAGQAAESLAMTLRDVDPTITCKRARASSDAMDFGGVLQVFLAGQATIELAKGLSNWLLRTYSSKLTIIDKNGEIIVENITAKQAVGLAEKLRGRS